MTYILPKDDFSKSFFGTSIHDYRRYYDPEAGRREKLEILSEPQPKRYYLSGGATHNKSSCVFSLLITNTGSHALENYKLIFRFSEGAIVSDTVDKRSAFIDDGEYDYDTYKNGAPLTYTFEPSQMVLIQKDAICTDEICIRPTTVDPQTLCIAWQLIAKDFDTSGRLTVKLNTRVIEKSTSEEYEYPLEDEVRLDNYFDNENIEGT